MPAAHLVAPLGRRDPQDALRLAALDVLRRVEDRKIAPDDLIRPIPFNPFSSGVPTDHPPLGVEHEDGVILDAFDQQSKSFPGLPLCPNPRSEPREGQAEEYPECAEGNGSDFIQPAIVSE